MQLHTLKRNNPNKKSRQIGRGTTRGKTAGRGTKGQKARAGHKMRPELRDIIKKLPKRRGYGKNRADTVFTNRPRASEAMLVSIEKYFDNNVTITPATLVEKGIVRRISGKISPVKIIGNVVVTKKFTVSGCTISAGAKASIEKAGGSVQLPQAGDYLTTRKKIFENENIKSIHTKAKKFNKTGRKVA